MKIATLAVITWQDKTLLGKKKKGEIGKDTWNGPGGKLEEGETLRQCLIRETREELNIKLLEEKLKKVAIITFYNGTDSKWRVHVYRTDDFVGSPQETEDMLPAWHANDDLPYSEMLESDREWFKRAVDGEPFCAKVYYRDGTKDFERIEFEDFEDFDEEL